MDGLGPEDWVALLAMSWLVGAVLWVVRGVRSGQALADTLAFRHPDAFDALGRPRPGYLDGPQRDRWFRVLLGREFTSLNDPPLVQALERHRRWLVRTLALAIGGLLLVAGLIFALRAQG